MLPTSGPLKSSSITSTSLSTQSLLGVAQTTLLLPPTLHSASAVFVDRTGLNSHLDSSIYPPHNLSTKTDDRFSFSTFEPVQAANGFPTFPNSQSSNPGKQFPLLEDIEMFLEEEKRSKSEERNTTPSSDYSSSSDEILIQDGDGRMPKRREKKKQQNREAATRYREKKRKERQEAKQKEDVLRQQNEVLKIKIGEIQTEIDYLKRLMHEIGMDDEHIKYISPVVPL
ncbi:unnamed protein product, partial [Mesorhabditis belari]|uniref:BZIP domain-containing protein n=1 Tax=Mesorhabditis belari TaxID=2138241 RepID=A0AAF3FIK5_9BILA